MNTSLLATPGRVHDEKERPYRERAAARDIRRLSSRHVQVSHWTYALILAVFSMTRLAGLTHQSLWFDEGYTLSLASAADFSSFYKTFLSFTTSEHLQPLYYFFIFAWSRVAGTSDLAMRLPSAIFSILSGLAVYDIGLHIPGYKAELRRHTYALLASLALAISSFSLYYAQEARPYALLQLLSLTLLGLWIRRKARENSPAAFTGQAISDNVAWTALVCALCVLGSSFTALEVLSLAAADLLITINLKSRFQVRTQLGLALRAWLRSWAVPLAFSAISFLAYWWIVLRRLPLVAAMDVTSIKQPLWMNIGYTIFGVFFGTTIGPSGEILRGPSPLHAVLLFAPVLPACLLVMGALAGGVILVLRKPDPLSLVRNTLALATAIYAGAFFGLFGIIGRLNILPRHASALFSLLFVLVLLCFCPSDTEHRRSARTWLTAGVAGWLLINLYSIYGYHFRPAFRKDDYRSVAKFISKGNVPVFMAAGQPNLMLHYGAPLIDATEVEPRDLAKFIYTHSNGTHDVEVLMNDYRGFRWDRSPSPAQVLAPDFVCATERHLAYMDVIACQSASSTPAAASPDSGSAQPRRTP